MIDTNLLMLFIPTFLAVSATPGMCMTLAMTLGMSIGIRRTLWMMWGELLGVAIVAVSAVIGVAQIMLEHPALFSILKYFGGTYLCFLGFKLWRTEIFFEAHFDQAMQNLSRKTLFSQGFISAVANPKGWAFTIALLPPFINTQLPLMFQLSVLVGIILLSEFFFMLIYAVGGKTLRRLLQHNGRLIWLNRISGSLMAMVGLWLMFG